MEIKTTIIAIIITALLTFAVTCSILDTHDEDEEPAYESEETTPTYEYDECHYCNEDTPVDFLFENKNELVCPRCIYPEITEILSTKTGKCYRCKNFYYHSDSYGLGLCSDCGYDVVTECAFCWADTIRWNDTCWYSICPDCLGEVSENTELQELLAEYHELLLGGE